MNRGDEAISVGLARKGIATPRQVGARNDNRKGPRMASGQPLEIDACAGIIEKESLAEHMSQDGRCWQASAVRYSQPLDAKTQ